jgi:hypothetical protein
MIGGITLNGWSFAFGSSRSPFDGPIPPDGPTALSLLVLIVGFAISMIKKKPIGKWIGILPLIVTLKLSTVFGGNQETMMFSIKFLIGAYLIFWVSLATAIIGFIGREQPAKGDSL